MAQAPTAGCRRSRPRPADLRGKHRCQVRPWSWRNRTIWMRTAGGAVVLTGPVRRGAGDPPPSAQAEQVQAGPVLRSCGYCLGLASFRRPPPQSAPRPDAAHRTRAAAGPAPSQRRDAVPPGSAACLGVAGWRRLGEPSPVGSAPGVRGQPMVIRMCGRSAGFSHPSTASSSASGRATQPSVYPSGMSSWRKMPAPWSGGLGILTSMKCW
jgi:hypothetical protein